MRSRSRADVEEPIRAGGGYEGHSTGQVVGPSSALPSIWIIKPRNISPRGVVVPFSAFEHHCTGVSYFSSCRTNGWFGFWGPSWCGGVSKLRSLTSGVRRTRSAWVYNLTGGVSSWPCAAARSCTAEAVEVALVYEAARTNWQSARPYTGNRRG
jgi:hypothetical protein